MLWAMARARPMWLWLEARRRRRAVQSAVISSAPVNSAHARILDAATRAAFLGRAAQLSNNTARALSAPRPADALAHAARNRAITRSPCVGLLGEQLVPEVRAFVVVKSVFEVDVVHTSRRQNVGGGRAVLSGVWSALLGVAARARRDATASRRVGDATGGAFHELVQAVADGLVFCLGDGDHCQQLLPTIGSRERNITHVRPPTAPKHVAQCVPTQNRALAPRRQHARAHTRRATVMCAPPTVGVGRVKRGTVRRRRLVAVDAVRRDDRRGRPLRRAAQLYTYNALATSRAAALPPPPREIRPVAARTASRLPLDERS